MTGPGTGGGSDGDDLMTAVGLFALITVAVVAVILLWQVAVLLTVPAIIGHILFYLVWKPITRRRRSPGTGGGPDDDPVR